MIIPTKLLVYYTSGDHARRQACFIKFLCREHHHEPRCVTICKEVDTVLGNIEKLGELLGVDAKVTQSLVTTDPR